MNITENIRIAIFSIKTNLMRSLLTMLGIIIGVCSVIAIITVGTGGKDYIISMLSEMGSSVINITVSGAAEASDYVTLEDVRALKNLEGVEYISPVMYGIGTGSTEVATSDMVIAIAGTVDLQYVMNINMEKGRFYSDEEFNSASRVCVVSNIKAKSIFGTEDCIGKYFNYTYNNQTLSLKVIGIYDAAAMTGMSSDSADFTSMLDQDPTNSLMIIVPGTILDTMQGGKSAYNLLYVTANETNDLESIGNIVANVLYSRHNNFGSEAYLVSNMATYIGILDKVISILTTFIAGVSAISLLVGGIGVMNIMLVSVTERTREIGIRKSLGAKTSTIMFQFLTESVILCLIGGLIGLMLGVVGAYAIAGYMKIPITIKFSTIAIAVGFSSAIGIFFGIYPARRAAKMLPIDALRRD